LPLHIAKGTAHCEKHTHRVRKGKEGWLGVKLNARGRGEGGSSHKKNLSRGVKRQIESGE